MVTSLLSINANMHPPSVKMVTFPWKAFKIAFEVTYGKARTPKIVPSLANWFHHETNRCAKWALRWIYKMVRWELKWKRIDLEVGVHEQQALTYLPNLPEFETSARYCGSINVFPTVKPSGMAPFSTSFRKTMQVWCIYPEEQSWESAWHPP